MTAGHGHGGHGGHDSRDPAFPRYKDGFPVTEGSKVTDKACLCIFLAYMAGMVCVVLYAFQHGSPERSTHGVDYANNICGVDEAVIDKPFGYWCGSVAHGRQGPNNEWPKVIEKGATVCLSSCPKNNSVLIPCLMPAVNNFSALSKPPGLLDGRTVEVTFDMVVTQSVAAQTSYESQEWLGRFCLPVETNKNDLWKQGYGIWYDEYGWSETVGTLKKAWPLLLFIAFVALFLGYGYLLLLGKYAGLIMLLSMFISGILCLGGGLFFLWAIFIRTNANGTYQKANPYYQKFDGWEASVYSIWTGLILLLGATMIACVTFVSVKHIDEMVGLVDAARECIWGEGADYGFQMWPIIQSGMFIGLSIFAIFIGLPYVYTIGSSNFGEFQVNGVDIQGIHKMWEKTQFESWMIWYYIVGLIWMWEVAIQLGNITLSYAVCTWYFQPVTEKNNMEGSNDMKRVLYEAGLGIGKNVKVRVGGADNIHGERVGVMKEIADKDGKSGGKVLVIPVGRRGPGTGRTEFRTTSIVKEKTHCAVCSGMYHGLRYHLGSLALSAILISFFRIPRMFVQCVQGFMTRTDDPGVQGMGFDQKEKSQQVRGFCALLSQLCDFIVGKYSKMGLTQLVLCGGQPDLGFYECCYHSFEFIANAGGTLAYLHGALFVYEYFGMFAVTSICTWLTLILSGSLSWFCDPDSFFYIKDRTSTCFWALAISTVVSFSCMTLFNHTADTLLYAVTWNRKMHHMARDKNRPVVEFASAGIRALVGEEELKPDFEEGLTAHGPGQVGALANALEAGVLQTKAHEPTYFKMHEAGHGGAVGPMSTMGTTVMNQYMWYAH